MLFNWVIFLRDLIICDWLGSFLIQVSQIDQVIIFRDKSLKKEESKMMLIN